MNEQVTAQPFTAEDRATGMMVANWTLTHRTQCSTEVIDAAHQERRWDATLRALEAELVTVRTEKHTALRERDHWLDRLIVEQEKHTETDAARTKWLFKAAELERERDALKEELEEVSADRDSWRSVTRYD